MSRTEFVRPVHWLVMLLGDEVVEAEVMGLGGRYTAVTASTTTTPSSWQ